MLNKWILYSNKALQPKPFGPEGSDVAHLHMDCSPVSQLRKKTLIRKNALLLSLTSNPFLCGMKSRLFLMMHQRSMLWLWDALSLFSLHSLCLCCALLLTVLWACCATSSSWAFSCALPPAGMPFLVGKQATKGQELQLWSQADAHPNPHSVTVRLLDRSYADC